MTPPTASFTSGPQTSSIDELKKNLTSSKNSGAAPLAAYQQYVPIKAGKEPVEDYEVR